MTESEIMKKYLPKIREIKIFKYLKEEELDMLLKKAEIIDYEEGNRIISQGEVSEYLFAILKGNVYVSVSCFEKEDIFICTIGDKEVFGEAAVFMTEKRTASVTSSEYTTILRIHRTDMLYFIRKYPEGGIKILMLIINSLLNKLRSSNMEIALEKQSDIKLEDIEPIIRNIMMEM